MPSLVCSFSPRAQLRGLKELYAHETTISVWCNPNLLVHQPTQISFTPIQCSMSTFLR